jgi:hypothetical protein
MKIPGNVPYFVGVTTLLHRAASIRRRGIVVVRSPRERNKPHLP